MNTVRSKPQSKNRPKSKARARARVTRNRRPDRRRGIWIVVVVVIAIGIAAVVAVGSGSNSNSGDQLASPALLAKVTSVPQSVFDKVGVGSAQAAPKPITAPALTADSKPHVVYIGAEYCPYCATERWPIVIALSRFGTFSGLKTTHSSSTDVFPDTQTFSFGSTYTSQWISFSGVELQANERQGDGYAPLDTPTAQEQHLLETYDKAPYTGGSQSGGGIPFVDFGGKFVIGGVTYDPSVLQGKSADDIAGALTDPTSAISRGAVGAANTMTAAICSMTNDQPGRVCSQPIVQRIKSSLK